jgi:phosphoglycolate phosphatase
MVPVVRPLPRLSAFLFDLDGTLVRTPIDFAGMKRSVLEIAESFGLDPEAFRPFDILGIIEQAELELERRGSSNGTIAGDADSSLRSRAEVELTRFELEAASVAEELPGAQRTLKELKDQGHKVAIVTRNCRTAVEVALQRVPLPHDLLLTRNDVPRTKPDPEHLLEAARRLGLPAPHCAMIGDHPMDVQAGKAAGMFSVAVQTRDPSPDAFKAVQPDLILPSVADLLSHLNSWTSA